MDALIGEVYRSLTEEKIYFKTITVRVRFEGFETKTKAKTILHYHNDEETIRGCAHELLRELFCGRKIRLVGPAALGTETAGRPGSNCFLARMTKKRRANEGRNAKTD